MKTDCICKHHREAHDMDEQLAFTGKCLMKEDYCNCKKYRVGGQ